MSIYFGFRKCMRTADFPEFAISSMISYGNVHKILDFRNNYA